MKKGLKKFYNLVESLEALPTIGKKSAIRLAYHMLMVDNLSAMKIAHDIEEALHFVKKCHTCGAMSENEICELCLDESRTDSVLCIVDNPKDIFTIEESANYNGRYFVLDALEHQNIEHLKAVIAKNHTEEIIFAFTPSLASDGLIMVIEDKLKDTAVRFTKIAQGVPTGVGFENVDAVSITRAFEGRVKI